MPLLEPTSLVADGVPVPVAPLEEPALLVAAGVPVLLIAVPLAEPLLEELLPIPVNEKACQGTRTWLPIAVEPPALLVADGVPVPLALLLEPLLEEPALLVAEEVPVLDCEAPLDELLLDEPLLELLPLKFITR
jgi:hypothetical protein